MISAQEVVKRVKESGRPFAYGTFKGYNRRGLIPEKKSASTDDGKLVWVYPEHTADIINRIIDERNRGASLDYIAASLWLDIAFAEMSNEELNLIKKFLGDYVFHDPDERVRVVSALSAGLGFLEELWRAHVPKEKLIRLYIEMFQKLKLLIGFRRGEISEEDFEERFKPHPELEAETIEFAEELHATWRKRVEAKTRKE